MCHNVLKYNLPWCISTLQVFNNKRNNNPYLESVRHLHQIFHYNSTLVVSDFHPISWPLKQNKIHENAFVFYFKYVLEIKKKIAASVFSNENNQCGYK